jgi:prepilin-type N-terminal cleavage/methylation domain-containing protein
MRKNNSPGYSLIEVLIALSLTGVVTAVLTTSFRQVIHTQQLLAGRVAALAIGQGKLAELENGSEPGSSGDFSEPYKKYSWYAKEETAEDEIKIISLTVEWKEGFTKHQVSFKGYRDPE